MNFISHIHLVKSQEEAFGQLERWLAEISACHIHAGWSDFQPCQVAAFEGFMLVARATSVAHHRPVASLLPARVGSKVKTLRRASTAVLCSSFPQTAWVIWVRSSKQRQISHLYLTHPSKSQVLRVCQFRQKSLLIQLLICFLLFGSTYYIELVIKMV